MQPFLLKTTPAHTHSSKKHYHEPMPLAPAASALLDYGACPSPLFFFRFTGSQSAWHTAVSTAAAAAITTAATVIASGSCTGAASRLVLPAVNATPAILSARTNRGGRPSCMVFMFQHVKMLMNEHNSQHHRAAGDPCRNDLPRRYGSRPLDSRRRNEFAGACLSG
jgi:hypothetical protein